MKYSIIICYILFLYNPIFTSLIEDKDKENTIFLVAKINEIFALTEISQYFTNPLNTSIELSVTFPIIKDIFLLQNSLYLLEIKLFHQK